MRCYLCLKNILDNNNSIAFDTPQASELHIKTIIEKHFWLQINDVEAVNYAICLDCWFCLKAFHEFYLNIEAAHKALEAAPLKSCNDEESISAAEDSSQASAVYCIAEVSIKDETEYNAEQQNHAVEQTACQKKRGRIKQQTEFAECAADNEVEQISLNEIKIELPEADPTIEDALDDDIVESSPITSKQKPPQRHRERDKNHKLVRTPRKHKGAQRKTNEYDEFIKANFKLHCVICNDLLTDFTALNKHYRALHKSRGYAMCCNKKFYERGVLVDHLHSHKDPEYFKCKFCAKILSDRQCLEQHMMMHDTRKFKCEICEKSFYKQLLLKRHELTHVPKEQRNVHCTQCEKTFPSEYLMQMHLKSVHLNLYAKICDVCGKLIRSRELLERHMAEHTGEQLQHIQCDLCGVSLTTVHGLKRHKKMMHDEQNRKPIQCPVCFKTSPNLAAHKNHVQFMHSMARKHQCPMCDKAFKRNSELRDHMTTHTGEELYTCSYCPKTFKSNANRHKHRKKMHPVEWEAQRLQRYQGTLTKDNAANLSAAKTNNAVEQKCTENVSS